MVLDLCKLVDNMEDAVKRHNLGKTGAYRRWNLSDIPNRDMGINPYGCADAANILYTINRFPRDPQERAGWVEALQGLQDPESGMYKEATHHPIHTTAHCLAALELFDAGALHPITELDELRDPDKMVAFLDALNWKMPWTESHRGAGLYVSLVLSESVTLEWQERYFQWLWDETDPKTGYFRKDMVIPVTHGETHSIFPYLAGSFHYLFNHEYARKPLHYPERMIDTSLDLYYDQTYPLGDRFGFAEIDWVFCLTRPFRQCGYRAVEIKTALTSFAEKYVDFLYSVDPVTHDSFNDLHMLFGTVCALAELQTALPGMIRTQKPLRLVLDRRPFI